MDTALVPFRVEVPDSELADLTRRLAATRWPDAETVDDWSQGMPLAYAKELAEYWANVYDWRATEARLNAIPQFKTEIDGVGIHFLHAKSPHANAKPLLLTHGWPGSVAEFLDVIEPLTNPPDPADAFHVVAPSLPGYGFSDKPTGTGWTLEHIAEAFVTLMGRVGYDKFYAHGNDWGSFITGILGHIAPEHVEAIHLVMPFASAPEAEVQLTQRDYEGLGALKEFAAKESAYAAVMNTKPQSLAYGLTDSPIGQLGWAGEKYWSWSDHDGDAEKIISRDRILDMVSVCWFTTTAASSGRLYWESYNKSPLTQVGVPTGFSVFPADARMPKAWAEHRFTDLRYWKEMPAGGHFPALENPVVLVEELRTFFRLVRA
ncbi:epoxide hydrolase family protein [Lentzea sp. NPDC058450]|uniref:epoxide hydrolase family protein n=1 Tax=Lentzea sp. NPDC058450 TaxID=3346505 RepID=UPI0036527F68